MGLWREREGWGGGGREVLMGMGREGEGDALRVVFAANFDVWRRRWSNWSRYARVLVKDIIEATQDCLFYAAGQCFVVVILKRNRAEQCR